MDYLVQLDFDKQKKENKTMKKALVLILALFMALSFTNWASAATTYKDDNVTVTSDAITTVGDVIFRTSLLAVGRVGAASTVASSSTNLAPASLPYSVLTKFICGAGGLDLTDGGTRLQNGTKGQMLVLICGGVLTGGSWIVTPVTSSTLTTITFDAAKETATLTYFDDTTGWVLIGSEGATIAYDAISTP